jgi:hypothetical protein
MNLDHLTRAEIVAWLKQQPQETGLGTIGDYACDCPVAFFLRGNGYEDAIVSGKYDAVVGGKLVDLPEEVGELVEAFDDMVDYDHTIGEFLAFIGE